MAMLYIRCSTAVLSLRSPGFDSRLFHVALFEQKLAVGQVSVPILRYFPVGITNFPLTHTHTLLSSNSAVKLVAINSVKTPLSLSLSLSRSPLSINIHKDVLDILYARHINLHLPSQCQCFLSVRLFSCLDQITKSNTEKLC